MSEPPLPYDKAEYEALSAILHEYFDPIEFKDITKLYYLKNFFIATLTFFILRKQKEQKETKSQ